MFVITLSNFVRYVVTTRIIDGGNPWEDIKV